VTYLDRLAARASTGASVEGISARPRLPSRFEAPAAEPFAASTQSQAVDQDELQVTSPRSTSVHASPADLAHPTDSVSSIAEPFEVRPADLTLHAADSAVIQAKPEAHDRLAVDGIPRGADALIADPARESAVRSEPRSVAASARVTATPVIVARADVAHAASEVVAADARPDIVTVSIGRIEVRATIAGPAPSPVPAPSPPSRPTLSLTDYLDGRRATR
jgi:hypothetical protein